jgi:hypothetical protein
MHAIIFIAMQLTAIATFGQNNDLTAGDIVFVSYQSDMDASNSSTPPGTTNFNDRFSILVLRPGGIPGNSTIYITDLGWNASSSSFIQNVTEGFISWQTPSTGVTQGTTIHFISSVISQAISWNAYTSKSGTTTIGQTSNNLNGTAIDLSASGDQLLIYQTGPPNGPAGSYNNSVRRFITAIHANNENNITSYGTWDGNNPMSNSQSNVPPGLVTGVTAFLLSPGPLPGNSDGITEPDNGKYHCSHATNSSYPPTVLAWVIYNPANWTYSNSAFPVGATSDDCIYSISEALLPVNLLSFSAQSKGNGILLQWQTAEETDNGYFELERSIDGSNYSVVQRIAGRNGIALQQYEWNDETVAVIHIRRFLYRLKIVSVTGKAEYSHTVVVHIDKQSSLISSVQPNPVSSTLHIGLTMPAKGRLTITLLDINGRVLRKEHIMVPKGSSNYVMNDMERLPAGIYLLSAGFEDQETTWKISR